MTVINYKEREKGGIENERVIKLSLTWEVAFSLPLRYFTDVTGKNTFLRAVNAFKMLFYNYSLPRENYISICANDKKPF